MTNLQLLNALLYVVEQGCQWRGLPKYFGNWHTIYTRMNRWRKTGVLDRVFARLQAEQILRIRIEGVCLDSTTVKVHPDGTGALKKRAPSHRPFAGWLHYQDSSGCRECSVCLDAQAFAGPGRGCAAGARAVAGRRPGAAGVSVADGSG
jgi:transposase